MRFVPSISLTSLVCFAVRASFDLVHFLSFFGFFRLLIGANFGLFKIFVPDKK